MQSPKYLKRWALWALFMFSGFQSMGQLPYVRPFNYAQQTIPQQIYNMVEGTMGQLWLGTSSGLYHFNGKSVRPIPYADPVRQLDFTHMKIDTHGKLWGMNFANQLFYLDTDSLREFSFPAGFEMDGNFQNFALSKRCLWILTDRAVQGIDLHTSELVHDFRVSKSEFFDITTFQGAVHVLAQDKSFIFTDYGQILTKDHPLNQAGRFISTPHKLIITNRDLQRSAAVYKQDQWEHLPDFDLPADIVLYHLAYSGDGKIWLCTKEGGWLFDEVNGKAQLLFPDKQVTGVIADYQGNYWISTLGNGLWFCPSLDIRYYKPLPELAASQNYITRLLGSDKEGQCWAGSSNGLTFLIQYPQNRKLKTLGNDFKKEIMTINWLKEPDLLINSAAVFDVQGKELKQMPIPKDMAIYQQKYVLAARASVAEWLIPLESTKTAASHFMGIPLSEYESSRLELPTYTIRNQRSYSVCIDPEQERYWVGYADELYEYDFAGNHRILRSKQGEPITARRMCLDAQGRLYIGTFSQGLFIFEEGEQIASYGYGKLLTGKEVTRLLNHNDTIWLGTENEIGFLSHDLSHFTDILGNNALGKIEYSDFTPSANSLIIASGAQILEIQRNARPKTRALRMLSPQIQLQAGFLEISLEALNYANPDQTRLYYLLEGNGMNANWLFIDEAFTTLRYSKLDPGSYLLRAYAEDLMLGTMSVMEEIRITIPKPWWLEWWAYILMALGAVGLFGLVFWLWLTRYKQNQSQREMLWLSQLKAIKAQMNPHFMYNILNTVQGLVYSNHKSQAADLLGEFSDLMRKTLESSEIPYLPLADEIETLALYLNLEKSRFEGKQFEYVIQSEEVKDLLDMEIPSLLVQPFAENAIKHGLMHKNGEKHLGIVFGKFGQGIRISITDNGIGREHSAAIGARRGEKVRNFTLNTTQQRIALLNKIGRFKIDLQIEDLYSATGQPTGTQVVIDIAPSTADAWKRMLGAKVPLRYEPSATRKKPGL